MLSEGIQDPSNASHVCHVCKLIHGYYDHLSRLCAAS